MNQPLVPTSIAYGPFIVLIALSGCASSVPNDNSFANGAADYNGGQSRETFDANLTETEQLEANTASNCHFFKRCPSGSECVYVNGGPHVGLCHQVGQCEPQRVNASTRPGYVCSCFTSRAVRVANLNRITFAHGPEVSGPGWCNVYSLDEYRQGMRSGF